MERRRRARRLCTTLLLTAGLVFGNLMGSAAAQSSPTDSLYIGDVKDSSVRRFDEPTGAFVDIFVKSGNGGLLGPRGIVFDGSGNLLVAKHNVNQPIPGNTLPYDAATCR